MITLRGENMENLEEVKHIISIYNAYVNLYNIRKQKVYMKADIDNIDNNIEIRTGYGDAYNDMYHSMYLSNAISDLKNKQELTEEEYDILKMKFDDYMCKYGAKYIENI